MHRLIPASRSQVRGVVSWQLWAVFGNDLDGIYWPGEAPSEGAFWRWWLRNPFHNLFFHVLKTTRLDPQALDQPNYFRAWPPYIRRRIGEWDVYAGWRPWNGALGFACRREYN